MLIQAKTLESYLLQSRDGSLGKVEEVYFDDHFWTVRYLVADTGNWLTEREVLLSPYAVTSVEPTARTIAIDLTKQQIEGSPSIWRHTPVSRQFESDYYGYYGWPMYWGGPLLWGPYDYPDRNVANYANRAKMTQSWDPHLRSSQDMQGHDIQATDGEIGHIADLILDDRTWAIRYFVIATHNWLPGKKVLIAPEWIERISWAESKVFVNLPRATIQQAPEYTDTTELTRDYETKLHAFYHREGYWVSAPVTPEPAGKA